MSDQCDHPDVRCVEARGFRNIACFVCGRLFGNLNADGYFMAYNPPDIPRRVRAATDEERNDR